MKTFLGMLLGSLLFFLGVAMLQEREVFLSAWMPTEGTESVETEVVDLATPVIREYHQLLRHAYSSGGDGRFLERMPLADHLREELSAELEYLARNRRLQELDLIDAKCSKPRPLGLDRFAIDCREYWVIRTLWAANRQPSDPVRSQVNQVSYLLHDESGKWTILDWQLVPGTKMEQDSAEPEIVP